MQLEKRAIETIYQVPLGANLDNLSQEQRNFLFLHTDFGDKNVFGPFLYDVLPKNSPGRKTHQVKITIALRVFYSEEKPFITAIYLYRYNPELTPLENQRDVFDTLKPVAVLPFQQTADLAEKYRVLNDDNDYDFAEFRSIYQETEVNEWLGDPTMVLNFILIQEKPRKTLFQIDRQEKEKRQEQLRLSRLARSSATTRSSASSFQIYDDDDLRDLYSSIA